MFNQRRLGRIAVLRTVSNVELSIPVGAARRGGGRDRVVAPGPHPRRQPARARVARDGRPTRSRRRVAADYDALLVPGRIHQPGPAAPVRGRTAVRARVRCQRQADRHAVPRAVAAVVRRPDRRAHDDLLAGRPRRPGQRRRDLAAIARSCWMATGSPAAGRRTWRPSSSHASPFRGRRRAGRSRVVALMSAPQRDAAALPLRPWNGCRAPSSALVAVVGALLAVYLARDRRRCRCAD